MVEKLHVMSVISSRVVSVVDFMYAWQEYEDPPNHMFIITIVFMYAWREL